jgi:hypothetical protein
MTEFLFALSGIAMMAVACAVVYVLADREAGSGR